jgi:hypothetical protein
MVTPVRGREEQEGLRQGASLARPNPADLSFDPMFAALGRPIAGGMLQFPGVTGAGVSVRAKLKRIEGTASKARE